MKDGPHESDFARSGNCRERSDLGHRRLPILSAGNGAHGSIAGGTEDAKRSGSPNGVQFYDVTDGAAQSRRVAWSYEAPRAGMQQVDHWIAFWEDVEVK